MVFEKYDIRVIFPLDPSEGVHYTELVHDEYYDADVNKIYQIIAKEEDSINPTVDGKLGCEQYSSCTSDFEEELENWQNMLYEVSTKNSFRYINFEVCDLLYYDGIRNVSFLLDEYEREIPEEQRLQALDVDLRYTPTRWWGTRKRYISDWQKC